MTRATGVNQTSTPDPSSTPSRPQTAARRQSPGDQHTLDSGSAPTEQQRPSPLRQGPAHSAGQSQNRQSRTRWLWAAAVLVLCPVAGIGAALSFHALHQAAVPIFGRHLAYGFPVLVDMLILGSTLAYLAGATTGRALPGWRWTAHGGALSTLLLNALTASSGGTIPWHITPALVWSVLVEMTARQVTAHWQAPHTATGEPIPVRLWISSPVDAVRTWLQMARTGERSHRQARADLALRAAAEQALRTAMPQHRQRGTRQLIRKQLRAGALDSATLLQFLHDQDEGSTQQPAAAVVIQTFLTAAPAPAVGDVTTSSGPEEIAAAHLPGPPTPGTLPSADAPQPEFPAPARDGRKRARGEQARRRLSELDRRRGEVVTQILRAQPDVDGTQLARELGSRGWDLSPRTARRILARAARDRSPQQSEAHPAGEH